MDWYFNHKQCFKVNTPSFCFLQTHNFSLHNTLIDALESCSTEKNMSGWPHVHCITHVLIQNIVLLYWRHNCAKETCQHNKCGIIKVIACVNE